MGKIRLGMVGGGKGAFIGEIHRIAAQMDGQIELVCGAFSRNAEVSLASGQALYLPQNRCYSSFEQMMITEAKLPQKLRMQMVAIVTPNHSHFPIAKMAIEHGFDVICDKPATLNLSEALALKELLKNSNSLYALTHTYTGYPMVKEAKYRVANGELGTIKKIVVQYPQGWLASKDNEDSKQAKWRLDPQQGGISCCMADIGVHAANLVEYISGLTIEQVCADLSSVVEGRVVDDDGAVLLRFTNSPAKGVLLASQISIGEENNLSINIYGDKASLSWQQLEPNSLTLKYPDKATQLIRAGVGQLAAITLANMRTPAGHPEGYLEAFANIYVNFAEQIRAKNTNISPSDKANDVPGIEEALRGMAFIEGVVTASKSETKWHNLAASVVNNKEEG